MTNQELKEAIALLKQQAEEQSRVSDSLEGYINGLKKAKALNQTIARNKKIEKEIEAKMNEEFLRGNVRLAKDEFDKLQILKKQTAELEKQGKVLGEQLRQVNKQNLLLAKSGASMVKIFAKLPDLIEGGYKKLKGFGLFDMDKAVKKSALSMGLMTESSRAFSDDVRSAAKQSSMIGIYMQDLAKMQSDYSEELGRNVMLNESGLKAMGELAAATGLGAENAAKMAADMEQQGYSAERTRDFVEQTMNDTSKMGLNASKAVSYTHLRAHETLS
jgi:hypothetical protein